MPKSLPLPAGACDLAATGRRIAHCGTPQEALDLLKQHRPAMPGHTPALSDYLLSKWAGPLIQRVLTDESLLTPDVIRLLVAHSEARLLGGSYFGGSYTFDYWDEMLKGTPGWRDYIPVLHPTRCPVFNLT